MKQCCSKIAYRRHLWKEALWNIGGTSIRSWLCLSVSLFVCLLYSLSSDWPMDEALALLRQIHTVIVSRMHVTTGRRTSSQGAVRHDWTSYARLYVTDGLHISHYTSQLDFVAGGRNWSSRLGVMMLRHDPRLLYTLTVIKGHRSTVRIIRSNDGDVQSVLDAFRGKKYHETRLLSQRICSPGL